MSPSDAAVLDVAVRLGFLTREQASGPEPLSLLSPDQLEALRSVADRVRVLESASTAVEAPLDSSSDIPLRLGPYEIVRRIGSGATGIVCVARDTRLGREVALKILKGLRTHDDVQRFRREQKVLAKLNHPNIVGIFDVGDESGPPYYVMQLVNGMSLQEALAKRALSRPAAIDAVRQAAEAVHFAHQRGVLHRDLKPGNILVTPDGTAMVTDFGLAKVLEGDERGMSFSGVPIGTPAYMSPEQARGALRELDARTDVWGLGATLYDVLAGRPPFRGESLAATLQAILVEEVVRPREIDPSVPPDVETLCLKALWKDPNLRYPSAADFADDLKRFLAGRTTRARLPGAVYRARRWLVRAWVWVVASAAILLAVAGAWGWTRHTRTKLFRQSRENALRAYRARDWNAALLECRRAAEIRPDSELSAVAEECRRELDRDKARRDLQDRVRPVEDLLRDTRRDFYVKGTDIRKCLERVEQALADLEKTVSDPRHADDPAGWSTLGTGWYFVGDLERSEAALRKAESLAPQDGRVQHFLGRILNERAMAEFVRAGGGSARRKRARALEWSREAERRLEKGLSWADADPIDLLAARAFVAAVADKGGEMLKLCEEGLSRYGTGMGTEQFWYLRAWAHRGEKRIETLTRAIDQRPHYAWAYYLRGCEHAALGRHDRAIADLTQTLRINPRFPWVYRDRCLSHIETGNFDAALADADAAIRLSPEDAASYCNRALARQKKREFEGAEADFGEAIRLDPDCALYYRNRALLRRDMGRYPEAIEDCDRALKLDPKEIAAYVVRGLVRAARNEFQTAMDDFSKALQVDPNYADAWHSAGVVYCQTKQFKEALGCLDRAIQNKPALAVAWSDRGWVKYTLRDYDGAVSDCTEALRIDGSIMRAWHSRGLARNAKGDLHGAHSDFSEAIRLVPNWVDSRTNRATVRISLQDYQGAVEDMDVAIKLAPERGDLWCNRGLARACLKDLDGALADFDESIRLSPTLADAYLNRANIRHLKKDPRGALEDYRSALKHAPAEWPHRATAEKMIERIRSELGE